MKHTVDIQNTLEPEPSYLPTSTQLESWINKTLSELDVISELTIRIVNKEEIQTLNQTFRHKNKVTNVLSFPAELPEEIDLPLLGDIVICASVVEKEAVEQGKSLESHWAHMVIHGALHLLGFDHMTDIDAKKMEAKEIDILCFFGYPNPYKIEDPISK